MDRFFNVGESYADGIVMLRYRISLPSFEGYERINKFYETLTQKASDFCIGELKNYANERFKGCDRSDKRFRYEPLRYYLDGETFSDREDVIFVKLSAVLKKGSEEISRSYDAHAWDTDDQKLLSPAAVSKLYFPRMRSPVKLRKADGAFVKDGRLFVCRGNSIEEISIEDKKRL